MIVNDIKSFERELQSNRVIIIGGTNKNDIVLSLKKAYKFYEENGYDIRILDFENTSIDEIKNAIFTSTFFVTAKLVHVRNFNIIKARTEEEKINIDKGIIKELVELIRIVDSDTVLLFTIDGQIDLSNQVSKIVSEIGCLAHFVITKQDLPSFVEKLVNKEYKKAGRAEINYFLESINYSTQEVYNELNKLIDYTLDEPKITLQHIDDIVTKTLESNIFKMVDSIGKKEAHTALSILNTLINQKESELKILGMIIRQFRLLYLMKIIDERHKGMGEDEILRNLSLDGKKRFIIKNLRIQHQKFNRDEIIKNINLCLETDFSIKSGKLQDSKLALELLILNICK